MTHPSKIRRFALISLLFLSITACGTEDSKHPPYKQPDVEGTENDADHDEDIGPGGQDVGLDDTGPGGDADKDTEPIAPGAPSVDIISGPDVLTNQTSAVFEFECDQQDCAFECALASGFTDCESPVTYEDRSDGEHTFLVRATNTEDKRSAESEYTWTVDTVKPNITDFLAWPSRTNQTIARFVFESDKEGSTFECALDGGDFEPCTLMVEYGDLSEGEHSFEVRAIDPAGNVGDSESSTWTIDTRVPVVTITAGPKDDTYFTSAEFSFKCDKAPCSFECSIDGGAFEQCSSPQLFEGLELGDREIVVRAYDDLGNLGVSDPYEWTIVQPRWVQITAGDAHTCGRLNDGTVWCWGAGGLNRLGRSSSDNSSEPVQVEDDNDWEHISANGVQTCGIRNGGELYCWGFGVGGEAASGSVLRKFTGTNWTTVSMGSGAHACGIRGTGQLWCWGGNSHGQIGTGTGNANAPVRVGTANDWTDVSAGFSHTCGIRGTTPYCWGANDKGQLGVGDTTNRSTPTAGFTDGAISVALGHSHSLLSTTPGVMNWYLAYGAGSNTEGQLGLGHYNSPLMSFATNLAGNNLSFAKQVTGGLDFSCVIDPEKALKCVGLNSSGQLGRGHSTRSNTFVEIGNGNYNDVDAGQAHACAVDGAGRAWCWGAGGGGRLGTGNTNQVNVPTEVVWPY